MARIAQFQDTAEHLQYWQWPFPQRRLLCAPQCAEHRWNPGWRDSRQLAFLLRRASFRSSGQRIDELLTDVTGSDFTGGCAVPLPSRAPPIRSCRASVACRAAAALRGAKKTID